MSISKIFIPNSLCVYSQIKKIENILNRIFILLPGSCPRGGTCGCWGESKTLSWGFAMAPHRLRALVAFCKQFRPRLDSTELLTYMYSLGESTMPMGAKRLAGRSDYLGQNHQGETNRGTS